MVLLVARLEIDDVVDQKPRDGDDEESASLHPKHFKP